MVKNLSIFLLALLNFHFAFSQNIGIGTNTPAFKLDIKNGSINTDSSYRIRAIRVLAMSDQGSLFVGQGAGDVTTGAFNTFAGYLAGNFNTTGSSNSFYGTGAGWVNTTGSSNSFFGQHAGLANTNGSQNVAIGSKAGYSNIDGVANTYIGYAAGYSGTGVDGGGNTLVGYQSGYFNTSSANTFVGYQAGYANTDAFFNVFVGYETGSYNTTGESNTMVGANAGGVSTTGSNNAFFGQNAGASNTSGNHNSYFGNQSGVSNTTGSFNTMLGSFANAPAGNLSYATAVGYRATVNCSNCMALGGVIANGQQTRVGINNTTPLSDLHIIQQSNANLDFGRGIRLQSPNGKFWHFFLDPSNNFVFEYNSGVFAYIDPITGNFVSTSDSRLKTNITALPGVLDKVLSLEPKTYQYSASIDANRYTFGFIAQEVEKIFPDFVYTGEGGYKGIAYSNFSVIAIKAIQEQQALINKLEKKNQEQEEQFQKQIKILLARVEALEKKSQ